MTSNAQQLAAEVAATMGEVPDWFDHWDYSDTIADPVLPDEPMVPAMGITASQCAVDRSKYLPWDKAGGPNECKHGYARGIPCPDCDEDKLGIVHDDTARRLHSADALRTWPEPIRCSDTPAPRGRDILVYCNGWWCVTCYAVSQHWWDLITHWMKLPPAPRS